MASRFGDVLANQVDPIAHLGVEAEPARGPACLGHRSPTHTDAPALPTTSSESVDRRPGSRPGCGHRPQLSVQRGPGNPERLGDLHDRCPLGDHADGLLALDRAQHRGPAAPPAPGPGRGEPSLSALPD